MVRVLSQQSPLFIESLEEAVEATAAVCGGKKAFACVMRPDLADDPEAAHRWLLDALNPDRRTELHVKHVLRGCAYARDKYGCHILKHWVDHATGYDPSEPATELTPRQRIARRRTQLAAWGQELADEEAKLEQQERRAEGIQELRAAKAASNTR